MKVSEKSGGFADSRSCEVFSHRSPMVSKTTTSSNHSEKENSSPVVFPRRSHEYLVLRISSEETLLGILESRLYITREAVVMPGRAVRDSHGELGRFRQHEVILSSLS